MLQRIRKIRRAIQGFTLMELMVTVGIIALVLVGLLQLFIFCFNLSGIAADMTVATAELQGKMEEMRNHKFDHISTDYGSAGTPGNTFDLNQLDGTGTITLAGGLTGSDDILQVSITANWQSRYGRALDLELTSRIAKR